MDHEDCRDSFGHLAFDYGSGVCNQCMIVVLHDDLQKIALQWIKDNNFVLGYAGTPNEWHVKPEDLT